MRRQVSPQLEHLIREKAWELLDRGGVSRPPVDLVTLARLQGVRQILFETPAGADAELEPTDQGYIMRIAPDASPRRRRFSIAHEVGHTFFSHKRKSFRGATVRLEPRKTARLEYQAEERLCDIAAAELLMPDKLFRQAIPRDVDPSLREIQRLADIFDASILTTASRYAELSGRSFQINRWTTARNQLHPWPTIGSRLFCLPPCDPANPGDDIQSAVAKAYDSLGIVSWHGPDPSSYPHRILVEALALGRGEHRYVLSMIRSSTAF